MATWLANAATAVETPGKSRKSCWSRTVFWSWLQTISTAWVRRCSSMIINMRKIQNRSFELQVKEIETVNEYCVYCVCVLCINPVKQIIYTVLVSAWDVEIYIPDQEAVHRLHLVFECFVFKALAWMSGAALLKSAGLDMNDTVLRHFVDETNYVVSMAQRSLFAVHSVLDRGMSGKYLKAQVDTMRLCVIKSKRHGNPTQLSILLLRIHNIYTYGIGVKSGPHGTAFINCTCMFEGYIYLPSTHIYQRHS